MAYRPDPDEAAHLLLRALEGLEPGERDTVLKALLTGCLWPSFPSRAALGPSGGDVALRPMQVSLGRVAGGQANQPLVIRLPSDLHARFRKWSTSNGFTMAAVARGLIERFLEDRA